MSRGKRFNENNLDKKKVTYILGVCIFTILVILILILSGYRAKIRANQAISKIENNESFDASLVSSTEDKSINEVIEENKETVEEESKEEKIAINTSNESQIIANETEETKKELEFKAPLEGEILKDYYDSSLVYSETLEEWTVHLGIDIKAEKGSAVTASERGIVQSIKNDPRYGITIIIDHGEGLKTIYANLQTAEFVKEGQEIEKGKTIGSVGESATFEISDEPHLHFEMTKDGQNVNPSIYWK